MDRQNAKKRSSKRRIPRPRFTDEQKRLIVAAIEAGATEHVAAEAAGIAARTFRELRQRAEDRHPTRRSTPNLKAFFKEVDEVIARARMRREIEVAEKDPKHWLKYRARSKPGLDGWTEPVPEEPEADRPGAALSAEELQQVVSTLVVSGAVALPQCSDPSCTCTYHLLKGTEGDRDESR